MTLPHPDPKKRVDLALRVYRARLARLEAADAAVRHCAGLTLDDPLPFELQIEPALYDAERRLDRARARLRRLEVGARAPKH